MCCKTSKSIKSLYYKTVSINEKTEKGSFTANEKEILSNMGQGINFWGEGLRKNELGWYAF